MHAARLPGRHVLAGLASAEAHALRAEVQGVGRVRHVHVVVVLGHDLDRLETGILRCTNQFCIQQSAGNSTRPQGDVIERIGWHLSLDQDVAHL
jgi:hypothetical protein